MGLIRAALNAAGGTMASQWKEYFYVDALPDDDSQGESDSDSDNGSNGDSD